MWPLPETSGPNTARPWEIPLTWQSTEKRFISSKARTVITTPFSILPTAMFTATTSLPLTTAIPQNTKTLPGKLSNQLNSFKKKNNQPTQPAIDKEVLLPGSYQPTA